jgi:hypothetical protein
MAATSATSLVCLGVPIGHAPALGGFDALNAHFTTAIQDVQALIQADRSRKLPAFSATLFAKKGKKAAAASGQPVSVFQDCGLPLVRGFRGFVDSLSGELSAKSLPFVGFGSASTFGIDTISPVWQDPPLAILRQFIPVGFDRLKLFHQHINFLTRLNPDDEIWQDTSTASAGRWFSTFGGGLNGYMTELFSGRFVDRNGTAVSFDSRAALADLAKLDAKGVAPQLVGAIVSTLAEFLGDSLFQVPYYAGRALASYRDYRGNKEGSDAAKVTIEKLRLAVKNGAISAADALALLGYADGTDPVTLDFSPVSSGTTSKPLVDSVAARILLQKVEQLDTSYLGQLLGIISGDKALDDIEAGSSDVLKTSTCFKAGVITDRLTDEFVPDSTAQGTPGRAPAGDTGRLDGKKTDYADLVGKLVAFAGTSAEKSVRSLVGGLVRGVAIASLQNEVLAEVIDGLAGTLAKKLVEAVVCRGLMSFIDDTSGTPTADQKRLVLDALALWHDVVAGKM